jgi:hypothetical protein
MIIREPLLGARIEKNDFPVFLVYCVIAFIFLCSAFYFYPRSRLISLGVREITCYHAVTAECGNSRGIGYYGKQLARAGEPLGNYCAANFLPHGTRIVIPELYGNRVFTVEDRMAEWVRRGRVDILVPLSVKGMGLRRAEVFMIKEAQK